MTKEPLPVSECPIVVELVENGRVTDSKTLPVAAAANPFTQERSKRRWAMSGTRVWGSGVEESSLSVAARMVLLGEGYSGLLVTETYGFSHVHEAHALYTVESGRLTEAWSFVERGGPSVSLAYPVSLEGRPHLLFWEETGGHGSGVKHGRNAALIGWSTAKGKVVSTPLPVKRNALYVVIASEEGLAQARKNGAPPPCDGMAGAWAQAAKEAGQPDLAEGALLGTLFFSLEEAQEHQRTLRECPRGVESSLHILTTREE